MEAIDGYLLMVVFLLLLKRVQLHLKTYLDRKQVCPPLVFYQLKQWAKVFQQENSFGNLKVSKRSNSRSMQIAPKNALLKKITLFFLNQKPEAHFESTTAVSANVGLFYV